MENDGSESIDIKKQLGNPKITFVVGKSHSKSDKF